MPELHTPAPTAIEADFLFEAQVKLGPALDIGPTPEGFRMTVPVIGGTFHGPRISGDVVPNSGADWSRIRPDGSGALDVRMTLRTSDDVLIHVYWHGVMVFAPEDQGYALDFAKPDDPDGAHRYYFRASPRFDVGDPRYAWLNNLLCVTRSRTGNGGVIHRVFAIR